MVVALIAVPTTAPAASARRPTVLAEMPVTATDIPSHTSYNSPAMVSDPGEARFVALAERLDAPDFSCGLSVSGDGGRGWIPANPVPTLPTGADKCYAPQVGFDGHGTLYYLFVGLHGDGNAPMGVFLTSSKDRARSFSVPALVLGPENFMVRMAIDASIGRLGRIQLVWLHASSSPSSGGLPPDGSPILAAHSDDGGRTFTTPTQVSDPARKRVVAPALVLAPGHRVVVAYYDLGNDAVDYQGLEGPTWDGKWSLPVSESRDGGRHFTFGPSVDDAIMAPGRVMLIFTMAPPALAADGSGRLYAAWPDARSGDPDIFFASSRGDTRGWTAARRLNDDPGGNGADQSLPKLAVAPGGRVDAIFYDRREDLPADVRNDVFYTYSTDGGRHFAPDLRLTAQPSDSRIGQRYQVPSAQGLAEFGSQLGLLSSGARVVAAWTDTRNARRGVSGQEIVSTEVLPPGSGGSNGHLWPWAVVAVAFLVAGGYTVRRLRARRSAPPRSPEHVAVPA